MSKNIVIIGTSRGIGAALVNFFAQQADCTVHALSRKQGSVVESEKVKYHSFDLGLDCRKSATALFEKIGSIDILINNAGFLVNKPFLELTHEDISMSYQTNIVGVMETVQAAVPFMNSKRSHIVNISSMGGFQGSMKFAGLAAYSTSKAALCSFTELFSEEYKETTITMNCLCLGAVQTEMLESAFPGYQAPLNPEQMASYIGDFSMNADQYLRGKIIPVSLSTP